MLMICTASRLQGKHSRHIRPRVSGDGIAALSAAAYSIRQAGLIVAGCSRESGENERDAPVTDAEPDVDA